MIQRILLATLVSGAALFSTTATAQVAADTVASTEAAPAAELNSTLDFGAYSISAPAGMISATPKEGQYASSLPNGAFSLVAFTSEGKPKNMLQIAGEAVRSLGMVPSELKEAQINGMKGFTTTQRINNRIISYALLRTGSHIVTVVITEPESLKPLGPDALLSLKRE